MGLFGKTHAPKIVQPGAKRGLVWLLVLLVIIPPAVWFGLNRDRFYPDFDVPGAMGEIAALKQRVQELELERSELHQAVARLERSSQIDREAALGLREEIKTLQDERLKMEEELVFLRRVVSKGSSKDGLGIKEFKLEKTAEEGVSRFQFTVSQPLGKDSAVTGKILISVDGKQDGASKSLPLKLLSDDKKEHLKMRFKHFQDVEGVLRLPAGFKPSYLIIEVQPDGKKMSAIKKKLKWAVKG